MTEPRFARPLFDAAEAHREWASSSDARIPIGYPVFDSRTKGIARGELLMFLARSGVGKTKWACNVACNCRRVPTIFFSLEMQQEHLLRRIAAIHTNTSTEQIEREAASYGESFAIDQVLRDFPYLMIIDTPSMSLKDMTVACEEYTEMNRGIRPRLIVIDYLELIKVPGMSKVEEIDKVSQNLKSWVREQDLAGLVLHQTNNLAGEGWEPVTRRHARYGGDVAADYTLGAYMPSLKPGAPQDNIFMLQFLKTRSGGGLSTGGEACIANPETCRIEPVRVPAYNGWAR